MSLSVGLLITITTNNVISTYLVSNIAEQITLYFVKHEALKYHIAYQMVRQYSSKLSYTDFVACRYVNETKYITKYHIHT